MNTDTKTLTPDLLHQMNAYWRAANYLSVGLFNCYEAFIHIIDSMFNQHAKWLKVTAGVQWRRKIASLNYLLASHVWRQDHNGYKEEGTITTPFDMTALNDLDRFHLVMDIIDRVPQTGEKGRALKQRMQAKLIEHKQYIDQHGQDLPEIRIGNGTRVALNDYPRFRLPLITTNGTLVRWLAGNSGRGCG